MLLDTPETIVDSQVIDAQMEENDPPFEQPTAETITVDEANEELQEVANEVAAELSDVQTDHPVSQVSEDDRRFWAQCEVLGEIAKCNRNIQEAESAIDDYKSKIKEEKELLTGEQIRLCRLASQVADIIEGKPLPIDPNKPKDGDKKVGPGKGEVAVIGVDGDEPEDNAWRLVPTGELLAGVSGLGPKKLEALIEAAPTAGDLEDLRGQASMAHQSFKEVLPKGCGQALADAIEDRLIKCVASNCKSAAEQAAEERAGSESIDIGSIVNGIRKQLETQRKDAKSKDEFIPEDTDDLNDPFVDGWLTYLDGTEIEAVNGAETAPDEETARNWISGWLTSEMVANWDGEYDDVE